MTDSAALSRFALDNADALQRTRVPKAAELVAQELRRRIVSGELKEGDNLPPELELIRHFQVSRPTLREAIRILETQDLISVRRGQRTGATVHLPTIKQAAFQTTLLFQIRHVTLADVIDTWLMLEPKIVGQLALQPDRRTLAALKKAIANDAPLVDTQVPGLDVDPSRFHSVIFESSPNPANGFLLAIVRQIIDKQFHSAAESRQRWRTHLRHTRQMHEDHERLVGCVERRDSLGAEELWRHHLEIPAKDVLKELGAKTIVALPT